MSFNNTLLGELLGEKGYIRGPFGSALKRSELKTYGIPVYEQQHAINNIRTFRFYIDDDKYKSLKRFTVQENDLIISCSGTVGQISVIRKNDPKGIISQALLILRPNTSKILPIFLYYFLTSPVGYSHLINASQGAVQLNLAPRAVVEKIPVPTPSIENQEKIVKTLSSLDDKIANNNRINKTLEAIAQALFKSWFVDFEPVRAKVQAIEEGNDPQLAAMCAISGKTEEELQQLPQEKYKQLSATADLFPDELIESELGMIPNGWKVSKLGNVTNFLSRGLTPKYADDGVAVINQRCIRNQTIDFSNVGYHDEEERAINTKQVLEGDILINSTGVGTLGRVAIVKRLEQKTTVDTHITIVRADSNLINPEYLGYFLLNKESIIEQMGEGSTGQTELKRVVLLDMVICLPERKIQNRFSNIVKRLISNVSNNEIENQRLTSIRDLLIPKLLSGYFEFE